MSNTDVKETQVKRNEARLEEYRDLVHAVVKDITHIGTWLSDDGQGVDIRIVFGTQFVVIPIKFEDIEKNKQSAKGFVDLIKLPLEVLLIK